MAKKLAVVLKYDEGGSHQIRGVKRVSKPGRRLYITDGGFLALATTEDSLKDVSIRRWDVNAGRFIENNEFRLLATCGGFGEHYASKK